MSDLPKTTWNELASLGWTKQQVLNALNPQRGNTMRNTDDLALNESFDVKLGWYCYNSLHGKPREGSVDIQTTADPTTDTTVWTRTNDEEYAILADEHTETWEDKETVSLKFTKSASIRLNANVTIENIFNSGLDLSIPTESSGTVTKSKTSTYSHTWTLMYAMSSTYPHCLYQRAQSKSSVGPKETKSLVRTAVKRTGTQAYSAGYGLADLPKDLIGTTGYKYKEVSEWAFSANHYLSAPSGTMELSGSLEDVKYQYRLITTKNGVQSVETLAAAQATVRKAGPGEYQDGVVVKFAYPRGAQIDA